MAWGLIYFLVMCGVWVAVVAYTFKEGLWSLLLTSFNFYFATLMTLNYFEPLASLLVSMWRGIYWFAPGICFWALFGTFLGIGRLATDALSKVKLKFHVPVEIIGRILLSLSLASNTVFTVQSGFFVSNLPVAVITNDLQARVFAPAVYTIAAAYVHFLGPVYSAFFPFSRMPFDETSLRIVRIPLKYILFRAAYASFDGMFAR